MADAALFEFLHTEMVAELWAQDPDPGPGGQKMSLSVLEGMGFRVGQALGERLPRETLAFREELDVLKFLCKDLWVAVFQKQMDSLRTNHQGPSSVHRGPTSCKTTASPSSSGWPRVRSTWRKRPSSWRSPVASYVAPSAPLASRAWSPPLWQPCPLVSSRW
ncbi:trafficking protein particle complex subunit 6A isoform X3 [Hippopotamus amphibius kiboko]|uniref:trafficking protein particle complex subunit 6A isoform X3 n=1 Tax=Hippopotamus amphibius kiboko TaxID=575201 RepID=UPI0025966187|nr:trafficking protein particle complex subunit 6A isoform X3 [Hippopotamus amphibius kiboko]